MVRKTIVLSRQIEAVISSLIGNDGSDGEVPSAYPAIRSKMSAAAIWPSVLVTCGSGLR